GTYAWQNYWDPSDDWSHQGLRIEKDNWTGTPEKTDYICVYDNGVLVGGIEPDGSTPVVTPSAPGATATATPTVKPTVTPIITVSPTVKPTLSIKPSSTPTPSVTATPLSKVSVTYSVVSDWQTGATVNVILQNNSAVSVNGWTVNWTFPNDQKITTMWNALYTQSGNSVTVNNAEYNSLIPANGSVSFGFNISYSSGNTNPTSFTVK
ncbi:MAG TPA: cellulose binding domain-containing protein, partial [Bacillota bacterium]